MRRALTGILVGAVVVIGIGIAAADKPVRAAGPSSGPAGNVGDLQIKASASAFGAYAGSACIGRVVQGLAANGAPTCVDYWHDGTPFIRLNHMSLGDDLSEHPEWPLFLSKNITAPSGVDRAVVMQMESQGNGTSFVGGGLVYLVQSDPPGVTHDNAGVMYPFHISVRPGVDRDGSHSPWDDVNPLVITNDGMGQATSAVMVGGSHQYWSTFAELSGSAAAAGIYMVDAIFPNKKAMLMPPDSYLYATVDANRANDRRIVGLATDGRVALGTSVKAGADASAPDLETPSLLTTPRTVSGLPMCAGAVNRGREYVVTDSSTTAWGTAVAGGGVNTVKAFCNGTMWTVR